MNMQTTLTVPPLTVLHIAEGMFRNLTDHLPMDNLEALGQNLQLFEHRINPFLLTEEQPIALATGISKICTAIDVEPDSTKH